MISIPSDPKAAALMFVLSFLILSTEARALPPLGVDDSGRFLVQLDDTAGEKPFFWLADTAWTLSALCREDTDGDGIGDIDQYMQDRTARGFNVIQGPIVIKTNSFTDSNLTPNCYGDVALESWFPGSITFNEAYLTHLDYIVAKAEEYGLYIALAVVWGSTFDHYFSVSNPGDAYNAGRILAQRFNQEHVIWIVTGEYHKIAWDALPRDRTDPTSEELELVRQMALGLESVHQGGQLMTVHPDGGRSSSNHFHDEPWLDFNMIQTFNISNSTANIVAEDWQRTPVKPTINGEPAYEDRDAGFTNDPITAFKVRYEAYHSVLQGAFGHTYGHWTIWQAAPDWPTALEAEGGSDMQHLRRLIESRPPTAVREPVQDIDMGVAESYQALSRSRMARAADGSYALVYFPGGNLSKNINLGAVAASNVNAWWYSPRDGQTYDTNGQPAPEPFATFSTAVPFQVFQSPGLNADEDWVLVLDDASRNFLAPGVVPEPPAIVSPPVEELPTGVETAPVEPTPVEPVPVEPTPVEPAPIEPAPVEPNPVEPSPAEPTPVEPTPEDPTPEPNPVEPTPVETTPAEPTPTAPPPAEPTPTEPAPAEPTPVEPVPVDPAPVEPSPAEPIPVESAPVEPTPAEPPAEESPVVSPPEQPTVDSDDLRESNWRDQLRDGSESTRSSGDGGSGWDADDGSDRDSGRRSGGGGWDR